jgi:hypothetical protein
LMELKDETLSATGASALLARMDGGRRFARIGSRNGDDGEGPSVGECVRARARAR